MLPLFYIYEGTKLVVVNKPSGLFSVPGKGEESQDDEAARIVSLLYPSKKKRKMEFSVPPES